MLFKRKILVKDDKKRPSINDIFNDPYIQQTLQSIISSRGEEMRN